MSDTTQATPEYKTSDLYYAAFLKTAGVTFLRLETGRGKGPERRHFFFFEKPEGGVRPLKMSFFTRQAKVDALSYADDIRALKALMYIDSEED